MDQYWIKEDLILETLSLIYRVLLLFQQMTFLFKQIFQVMKKVLLPQTPHARTFMVILSTQNSAKVLNLNTLSTPKLHQQYNLKA